MAVCMGGVRTGGVIVCCVGSKDLKRVATRRVGGGIAEAGGALGGHFGDCGGRTAAVVSLEAVVWLYSISGRSYRRDGPRMLP